MSMQYLEQGFLIIFARGTLFRRVEYCGTSVIVLYSTTNSTFLGTILISIIQFVSVDFSFFLVTNFIDYQIEAPD